ncbi:aldehyde dehydrogenase family protein [Olsenella uli]|uniref:aldehyde dehydrogenase family protein n=1 Tax=Olsenella uli TaxID=133926 RepID=UPI000D7AB86E|nr:MAG: aldehyde dehydrogenase family protein [Coriobacteriia bacterium]
MEASQVHAIVERQRAHFRSNATLPVAARKAALRRLYDVVSAHEGAIADALAADLGKSPDESYMCETGLSLAEIRHQISHVGRWAGRHLRPVDLANAISSAHVERVPYGVTLVMAPWNYPFLLTLEPLAGALAAGNTVVIKPSAYAPASSAELRRICEEAFGPELVAVVEGGRAENTALLDEAWDYIFFTGGVTVGKLVMSRASEHLTPVTLELGGKSPCIVDATANLRVAAERIAFGKWLNVGQTCVAPDYLLVDERVEEAFLSELARAVERQLGDAPLSNPEYGKMINRKHFDRVRGLIDPAKVVLGGESDEASLKIAPTVMRDVTAGDAVMGEEIFGPVLPVISYRALDEVIDFVRSRPTPLACYLFSEDRAAQRRVTAEVPFGGGCVNDCIMHLATSHMGFGGMGASGMGSYHGRKSFETFTHEKSVISKATFFDAPFRYAPHADWKRPFIHLFVH